MFSSDKFEEGFLKGALFGPMLIGVFFRAKECSVAVIYKFNGDLIDAQVFDKNGDQVL
jgi:hypothetical protein